MTVTIEKPKVDLPYRIQTSAGHRKYLCSGLYMPSVTTVLSATESEKSKAGLKTWQENNPGALEEASTRGSAIHLGCENYLRGLDPAVPEQYQPFWNGLSQYLDWFDTLHWSERPLRPDWNHLRSDDKEVAFVWSTEHLYAGCPDLIGEIGGVKVIADFKTSNDVALIIVSTPEITQAIFIDGDQLNLAESRFLKRCKLFHELNKDDTEDLRQQGVQE